MTRVSRWFERRFDFSFPADQHFNLCVRLRGTPPRLEELLRDATRDVLVAKPAGKWSAQEHAGHLLDLETLWRKRVEDFLEDGDTLTAADLTNRGTDEANHNAGSLSAILTGFRAARLGLVDRAEHLPSAAMSRTKRHPRLGQPIRIMDHLYFVAEHDDHHLATIWEMISGPRDG